MLQLLSGGSNESQPRLQVLTYLLPSGTSRFSQVIIYRGGCLSAVWEPFLMVSAVGVAFFVYSVSAFRKSIAVTK